MYPANPRELDEFFYTPVLHMNNNFENNKKWISLLHPVR